MELDMLTARQQIRATVFSRIFCLLIIFGTRRSVMTTTSGTQEHCDRDVMNIRCEPDAVIVVRLARYGRMREGRCITDVHGQVGCSLDVRPILDPVCSGLRQCRVDVGKLVKVKDQPCPIDFRSYLEILYDCSKVATLHDQKLCSTPHPLLLSEPSGLLSSLVAHETRCGSIDSPWLIRVERGQRILLTLLDFSYAASDSFINPSTASKSNSCRVKVIIKEVAGSTRRTICGGVQRESIIYKSQSNELELRLIASRESSGNAHEEEEADQEENDEEKKQGEGGQFLIKYEAMGCPDLVAPSGGWVKLAGEGSAEMGCYGEGDGGGLGKRWKMNCDGAAWKGDFYNCSEDGKQTLASDGLVWNVFLQSHGLSSIIIVSIAAVCGLVILGIGLIYMRTCRFARKAQHSQGSAGFMHRQGQARSDLKLLPISYQIPDYNLSKNDYRKTSRQLSQPHEVVHETATSSKLAILRGDACMMEPTSSCYFQGDSTMRSVASYSAAVYHSGSSPNTSEHVYESPIFERKKFVHGNVEKAADYYYYELDQDGVSVAVKL